MSLDYAGKTNYKDFNYFEAQHNGVTHILNAIEVAKTDKKNQRNFDFKQSIAITGSAQNKSVRDHRRI